MYMDTTGASKNINFMILINSLFNFSDVKRIEVKEEKDHFKILAIKKNKKPKV